MQTITTFLWFNDDAEEAVKFYASVFKKSKVKKIARYGAAAANAAGRPEGSVMTIEFQLMGQDFIALNGGPHFKFTEAISLVVKCRTQKEIDYYWAKLSAGGEKGQCGWLKDKYGLSWQVVPEEVFKMLPANAEAANRVMAAVTQMRKLDIKTLKKAYRGK